MLSMSETSEKTISTAPLIAGVLASEGRVWSVQDGALESLLARMEARIGDGEGEIVRERNRGRTAIIPVRGLLTKHGLSFFGIDFGSSYSGIVAAVQNAAAASEVDNIVLVIESPGGSVFGVGDAADAIFGARKIKPVFAFIDGLGTSAAYYLASQATRVVLSREEAITASIGVLTTISDWSSYYRNLGVIIHRVQSGSKKGIGVHGVAITEEDLAQVQGEIDFLARQFISDVARGRGISQVTVRGVADGWIMHAREAIKAGLADEIKPLRLLLAELEAASAPKVRAIELSNQRKQRANFVRAHLKEEADERFVNAVVASGWSPPKGKLQDSWHVLEPHFEDGEFAERAGKLGMSLGQAQAAWYAMGAGASIPA